MEEGKKFYKKLPGTPGVYLFKDARGGVLYIGKAANLRKRVASYFERPHDYRIERLVGAIKKIDYKKTDTALEALILESELIKKHQPPFNVKEKDDKSFLYLEITRDKFPRVLLARGKDKPAGERLAASKRKRVEWFGPFTSAGSVREALRLVRRIFPFSTHPSTELRASRAGRPCFDYEIGLCPGTCIGAISHGEYLKNIRNIKRLFKGKKKQILISLKREMRAASKALEFEKAETLRRQIFALQHIQDVAFIKDDNLKPNTYNLKPTFRIEGYDISNISGTSAVGSMVVFTNGKPDKDEYRKFRIKTVYGSNDVGMLKEVLYRRFRNNWPKPNLILIDGGMGQVNAAKLVLHKFNFLISVVGIAKGAKRKKNEFVGRIPPGTDEQTLIKVRDEAHRFAISYHKKLRGAKMMF
ncbi:MAG: excinuclease ABC subunit UvrC [Candidatus Liptonbacteria bacterium]|nr:excinuclease ABC subunit UvrC [Candidatus Liptonbacteria bacterium]